MTEKFSTKDRELVILELERIQKTKLRVLKTSKKIFIDENGLLYVLFGGKQDWHGMSKKMISEMKEYNKEGAFVVAKKYESKIDLCVGSLLMLIKNFDKLIKTKDSGLQFHNIITEDGLYLKEIPDLYLNKVGIIDYPDKKRNLDRLKSVSKIINIEIKEDTEITHSDVQAKLILIGSYLGFRTFTPDKNKSSIYGLLGDLCSEVEVPTDYIPPKQVDTIKYIDVIWFDDDGFPTHCFEVEHTTNVTNGLLRLYQVSKLKIKMFVISNEKNRNKFEKELNKNPFYKIKEEYIFKNYSELDVFFKSVKNFTRLQNEFLNEGK